MTRNQVLSYAKTAYGTDPEYLFASDPDIAVLRNPSGKWYAIIMKISPKVLGHKRPVGMKTDDEIRGGISDNSRISDYEKIDVMNVKLEPMMVGSFLQKQGFYPAYHMNKTHWISMVLEKRKTISDADIKDLLDISYKLTE